MNHEDPKTQLVVLLPVSEKGFIVEAVKESGAASMSAFIRTAMLERSSAVLGRDPPTTSTPRQVWQAPSKILNLYLGKNVPPGARMPAAALPNIRRFGTLLSDRNRALLNWVGANGSESIHDLSRRFDYPYVLLSRILHALAGHGIIQLRPNGADARRQSAWLLHDRLRLYLPLCGALDDTAGILRIAIGARAASEGADFVCPSMDDFSRSLTDGGYRMLRFIADHHPETIGAVGKLSGTTSQNAYSLLDRFAKFGLVRLEVTGRKKRPVLLYDGVTVDIDLRS
jgi:predicted transcriptional regulator